MIQPNKKYTFSYLGSAPVTWVVDVINPESDLIYLHQVGNGKTLLMSLKHFEALYRQHGVPD